jgi:hypothetical protein
VLVGEISDPISVVSTISKQHCAGFQTRQQGQNVTVVVRFASGQREAHRQPCGINDRVYLARKSTSGPTHQLFSVAGNTGPVLMHAHNGRMIICTAAS